MALTFFEDIPSTSDDLDFYGDWIANKKPAEIKKLEPFEVTEIVRAKSGKGYMVKTCSFACWLWNKQKTTTQLIEALDYYCKKGGFKLFVVAVSNKQDGYKIAVDKEYSQLWYNNGKKYTQEEVPEESQVVEGNPFL